MNTPQENRVALIIERALKLNDTIDCDIVQEAINDLEGVTTYDDALSCSFYLASNLKYRGANTDIIEKYINEIKSYESLLLAINNKNEQAQAYWNKQADAGVQMRII